MKKWMVVAWVALSLSAWATAGEFPGDSLYQIKSKWTDQDGKSVTLGDLSGHPVILSLVYLTCGYLCPTVISEVRALEKLLDPATQARVKIVLVSFDPDHDRPATMKRYQKKRALDPSRWIFLTGKNDAQVRELAATLDFKYQKTGKRDFSHSFLVLALDETGRTLARVDKANQPKDELVAALSVRR